MIRPSSVRRAFEIADESMLELLKHHAMAADDEGTKYRLIDEDEQTVSSLENASPEIREALEWLIPRRLVSVGIDAEGSYAVVDNKSERGRLVPSDGHCESIGGEMVAFEGNDIYNRCSDAITELVRGGGTDEKKWMEMRSTLAELRQGYEAAEALMFSLHRAYGFEQAKECAALIEALKGKPTVGPHHVYTHPRDDNNHMANAAWAAACEPQRIAGLIGLLLQEAR